MFLKELAPVFSSGSTRKEQNAGRLAESIRVYPAACGE